jgi:preprotein translocase subunit SecA
MNIYQAFKKKKISHALLNAKNHEKEAEIIAEAGQKGQ